MLVDIFRVLATVTVCAIAAHSASLSTPALQLLESLGLPSFSLNSIRQGERIRQQDSPIYYIKLPPVAPVHSYPQSNFAQQPYNSIDDTQQSFGGPLSLVGSNDIVGFEDVGGDLNAYGTTKSPFQKIPIDFTNNGRPHNIFHWSKPTLSDSHIQFLKSTSTPLTTTSTTTTTTTTTPRPTTKKPYLAPEVANSWPPHPEKVTTKKPWISFVKQFSANGKPNGLYIYKSKPVVKSYHKYKHPAFRHFNY